jgi:hypothetical protein
MKRNNRHQAIRSACVMRLTEDFRCATLTNGNVYYFTQALAAVVRALCDARRRGTHALHGDLLKARAGWRGRGSRIDPWVQRHPAWRSLIIPEGRAFYRLNPLVLLEHLCPPLGAGLFPRLYGCATPRGA